MSTSVAYEGIKNTIAAPTCTDIAALSLPTRKEKQFRESGINTLEELVRHFPVEYKDYSNPKRYVDLIDGDECSVVGTIINSSYKISGRLDMIFATIKDDNGNELRLVWFNQAYVRNQIKNGVSYAFCGKVSQDAEGKYPITLNVSAFDSDQSKILRFMPRYKKIKGMSDDYLTDAISRALTLIDNTDPVHQTFRDSVGVIGENEALCAIHFPKNKEELNRAIKRIEFDILLPFAYNMMIYSKQHTKSSMKVLQKNTWINIVAKSLPFPLTGDQKKSVTEMIKYINGFKRLNALVQGDVGCGKTLVAIMLMVSAAENKLQSCLLAPTEVLARQHYIEVLDRLKCLPDIKVELLTGSTKAAEKKDICKRLASGEIDIIIGTHAVIQNGVNFNSLGVAIIDEQHRFGVAQRERLIENNEPHIISMSATPIPRTLSMALYGDHTQVYNILEKPAGRQEIQTATIKDVVVAYKFAYKQIKAGRQVYVICPLVESSTSEKTAELQSVNATLKELEVGFKADPTIKIAAVHGKMKKAEIEATINDFAEGKTHILISTTVVEVGVNVPNATTIIIKNSERFGLAQLHQLRGRVGRSTHKSFCVLVCDKEGNERNEVLCSTNDGFKIAQEDLKLRGHGSYLGTRQSGQEPAVELMLSRPLLYEAVKKICTVIQNDSALRNHYSYLEND